MCGRQSSRASRANCAAYDTSGLAEVSAGARQDGVLALGGDQPASGQDGVVREGRENLRKLGPVPGGRVVTQAQAVGVRMHTKQTHLTQILAGVLPMTASGPCPLAATNQLIVISTKCVFFD